jgi:hypothetical protein
MKSHWHTADQYHGVAFGNRAKGMSIDRAGAGVSLPSHCNTMHECGT